MGTQIGLGKIVSIILAILVVAAVLFLLFKVNIIKWIKDLFPDFVFRSLI